MAYGQDCDWVIIVWDVFADTSIFHQLWQFRFQSFRPSTSLVFSVGKACSSMYLDNA